MRFTLISDNHDTLTGMRLAGIEGTLASSPESVEKALNDAIEQEDVAIVLMTERLVALCPDIVYDIKMKRARPLIVGIPDRHSAGLSEDSIMRYIREAIGVNF